MRSIIVMLEDLVQLEFGPSELAAVRAIAQAKLGTADSGSCGRMVALVEAMAEVRRQPVHEAYRFVSLMLVPPVLKEYPALLQGQTSARTVLMQITRLAPLVLGTLLPGIPDADFAVELIDVHTVRVRFEGPAEMLAALEGTTIGLARHFGERAETTRVPAPDFAPTRRLLDVRVGSDRREPVRSGQTAQQLQQERRRRFRL
jgi:hypothetical protein